MLLRSAKWIVRTVRVFRSDKARIFSHQAPAVSPTGQFVRMLGRMKKQIPVSPDALADSPELDHIRDDEARIRRETVID